MQESLEVASTQSQVTTPETSVASSEDVGHKKKRSRSVSSDDSLKKRLMLIFNFINDYQACLNSMFNFINDYQACLSSLLTVRKLYITSWNKTLQDFDYRGRRQTLLPVREINLKAYATNNSDSN